MKWRGGTAA